jgi:hypothetical protein
MGEWNMCRRAEELPAAAPETLSVRNNESERGVGVVFAGNREIGGN